MNKRVCKSAETTTVTATTVTGSTRSGPEADHWIGTDPDFNFQAALKQAIDKASTDSDATNPVNLGQVWVYLHGEGTGVYVELVNT
jgi:hypothetical protein